MTEHKKPTTPAFRVAFSADGKIRRQSLTLSTRKPVQEMQAISEFARLLNEAGDRSVSSVEPLEEADHDSLAVVDGQKVVLQLAELVSRQWLRDHSPPGQKMGVIEISLSGDDTQHRQVDIEAQDDALRSLIAGKLAKHYAKPQGCGMWLVIFTTSTYRTEYGKDGRTVISRGLKRARDFLVEASRMPDSGMVFDEIWFTNLRSKPVTVWPRCEDEPPVDE
jgi:hypothetical protein